MDLNEALDQFERQWHDGPPPGPETLVSLASSSAPEEGSRRLFLAEMVCIDLWHRWRWAATQNGCDGGNSSDRCWKSQHGAGVDALPSHPLLEDYVRRLPDLAPLDDLPPEIIVEEYRARAKWGDRPKHEEYAARFPRLAERLAELLSEIDNRADRDTTLTYGTVSEHGSPETNRPDSANGSRPIPETIGKYHVLAVLDEGGQALVLRAIHPDLQREVAIKLGRSDGPLPSLQREQLVAEARMVAGFEHPNLVRIHDLAFDEDRPYLVMDYVPGRNLRQLATHSRFSPREAAILVAKIARAVGAVHLRGVTHNDLKPGNIIVDDRGEPRLIDFGLARLRSAWTERPETSNCISGTIQYMAPEQASGESHRVGPRTDVFGLGAVLYFLLTGRPPFDGSTVHDCLDQARRCDYDASALRKPAIPKRLADICLHAMRADPDNRIESAEELADELEAFAERPRRVKRLVLVAAAAGLTLLPVVLGSVLLRPASEPSESAHASDPALALLERPPRNDFPFSFEVLGHPVDQAGRVEVMAGERVTFRFEAERDCFVGVWHIGDDQSATQFFPNEYDFDNYLPAGHSLSVPGSEQYAIAVTESEGPEYLYVIASSQQWEIGMGQRIGPYAVFATPEEVASWRENIRSMALVRRDGPAMAERVVQLHVGRGSPDSSR